MPVNKSGKNLQIMLFVLSTIFLNLCERSTHFIFSLTNYTLNLASKANKKRIVMI